MSDKLMNKLNSKDIINILILGFALFSTIFGAGNVIFPPYLGFISRESWFSSFILYFIADVGLTVIGLLALNKSEEPEKIANQIGKFYGTFLMTATMFCIGPLVAIPRTVATTYEMSILPFFPGNYKIIFSIIFCISLYVLSKNKSKIVDIIGKYLTPVLLLCLSVLIIYGIFCPISTTEILPLKNDLIELSIKSGYQTMDALSVIIIGSLVMKSIRNQGYTQKDQRSRVLIFSCVIASLLLFIIYSGLTFLGATSSPSIPASVPIAELSVIIINTLLGKAGMIVFAITVSLACLTTAVSLLGASAEYFSRLFNNKISYNTLVIAICISSVILANCGLDTIIAFASPILDAVFPPFLILIFISLFCPTIGKPAINGSVSMALAVSVIDIINQYIYPITFAEKIPFNNIGFGWFVPALVTGIICKLFTPKPKLIKKALSK